MRVALLLLDGMRGFDVAAALEVFADHRTDRAVPADDVHRVGVSDHVELEHGLVLRTEALEVATRADLVIVPGFADVRSTLASLDPGTAAAAVGVLCSAHAAGAQVASLCTGAFLLARSGLLDGTVATTHWRYCDLLRAAHPRVRVDANVLYTHDDERRVWTSAGVTAGIDLCLAILAREHGAAAAAAVARSMVLPATRPGGQAQYVPLRHRRGETLGGEFEGLRTLVRQDLARPWTLADLARASHLAPRTLQRRFGTEAGVSPTRWLLEERVTAARELLEVSGLTVDQIAQRVGFGSADLLRKHFTARLSIPPTRYREAFASTVRAVPES